MTPERLAVACSVHADCLLVACPGIEREVSRLNTALREAQINIQSLCQSIDRRVSERDALQRRVEALERELQGLKA